MKFKETSNGAFTHIDGITKVRYVIVNCHLAPKHKAAKGTNFFLSVGKADLFPIGDFYSLENAQNAAKNVANLIAEF